MQKRRQKSSTLDQRPMSKEQRRLALLEIGLTNIKKTVAVIDELVLLDGEDELRALTQRLQGAIFRAGFQSGK
jgi:hypothetical protein